MSEELQQRQRLNQQVSSIPAVAGVYGLLYIPHDAYYIGSSKNIRIRLKEHLSELRRDRHSNFLLQRRWNASNERDWVFLLLEICEPEIRFAKEQHFIDQCLSHFEGYNRSPRAGTSKTYEWTPEQRARHSEIQLRRYQLNPLSESEKQRLRDLNAGRYRPQEERDRIRKKLEGRVFSTATLQRMSEGQRRRYARTRG